MSGNSKNVVMTPLQLYQAMFRKTTRNNELHLLNTVELREIIRLAKEDNTNIKS